MPQFATPLVFLAALVLLTPPTARACLNDRDSDALAVEAKGLPDTIAVISGRFERNPPLFYQMRIRHVQAEIARHPAWLNLYDDVAVAYDRLGDDEQALYWITRKKARLEKLSESSALKENWYRYYANAGTFRAHRWLRGGAKPETLSQMTQARDEIARAVQIKPNAHFNREKYQLATMDWILASRGKNGSETGPLRQFLSRRVPTSETKAAIEGLSGLVVLGNAWESVDVFGALSELLLRDKRSKVAYLTFLRCEDLAKSGKVSLASPPWQKQSTPTKKQFGIDSPNDVYLENTFDKLNEASKEWQSKREVFMRSQLEKGKHPDINADFWKAYESEPSPSLLLNWDFESDKTATQAQRERQKMVKQARIALSQRKALTATVIVLGIPSAVIAALVDLTLRRRKKAVVKI